MIWGKYTVKFISATTDSSFDKTPILHTPKCWQYRDQSQYRYQRHDPLRKNYMPILIILVYYSPNNLYRVQNSFFSISNSYRLISHANANPFLITVQHTANTTDRVMQQHAEIQ